MIEEQKDSKTMSKSLTLDEKRDACYHLNLHLFRMNYFSFNSFCVILDFCPSSHFHVQSPLLACPTLLLSSHDVYQAFSLVNYPFFLRNIISAHKVYINRNIIRFPLKFRFTTVFEVFYCQVFQLPPFSISRSRWLRVARENTVGEINITVNY